MTDFVDALFLCPAAWSDRELVDEAEVTKEVLKSHGWERPPSLQMPGTRTYQGRQLVHAKLELTEDAANVIGAITSAVPGECVGALGAVIPAVYDYENPIVNTVLEKVLEHPAIVDPETEEVLIEAWQETIPAYTYETYPVITPEHREELVPLDRARILNWMNDVVDEDGNTSRPTVLRLHVFAGRSWYL